MTTPVIHGRNLGKSYQTDGATVPSLRQVDLDVAPGELLVLMGSSGSGKSTLLYLISGLERVSEGEIHCAGQPVHALDETALDSSAGPRSGSYSKPSTWSPT